MSVWEHLDLDQKVLDHLSTISAASTDSALTSDGKDLKAERGVIAAQQGLGDEKSVPRGEAQGIEEFQVRFGAAEKSCRNVLEELDSILAILEDVSSDYDDVTSRTNTLVMNCESLLEQQRDLEATVGKLNGLLDPFNELEQVAMLLGVPFDPHMNASGESDDTKKTVAHKIKTGNTLSDPRSPEFRHALHRLAKASAQVDQHPELEDAGKFRGWVKQLQSRALGLVSKAIRNLLENASQQASDLIIMAARQRKMAAGSSISVRGSSTSTSTSDEQPLESAPIYKKFRGLSFRMRELVTMLEPSSPDAPQASQSGSPQKSAVPSEGKDSLLTLGGLSEAPLALRDVTSTYVSLRTKLLSLYLGDVLKQLAESTGVLNRAESSSPRSGRNTPTNIAAVGSKESIASSESNSSGSGGTTGRSGSLCAYLRQAFSTLHRVAQLELQLYEALFVGTGDGSDEIGTVDGTIISNTGSKTDYREALALVEVAGNVVADQLRPPIIHEDSVDELCRVISVLGEDIRAHTMNARLPIQLRKELLRGLDKSICDAQERLNYCAELTLRKEVTKFTPTHVQVSYPDLLEAAVAEKEMEAGNEDGPEGHPAITSTSGDVSRLWYPTLRSTLSLLSRLYSAVEPGVFEDFARRSVDECVKSLQKGAEAVTKKNGNELMGSLFLVRHLLVLREQLIPFDLRLQGSERKLNFRPTGDALAVLKSRLPEALKLSRTNGLLRFALDGLPEMQESMLDVQGELDKVLKGACRHLRDAALRMLMGTALDGLMAKVEAFAGEIPVNHAQTSSLGGGDAPGALARGTSGPPTLSVEIATTLRKQAFLRPERLLAVLTDTQQSVEHSLPELKRLMGLFIDSPVARAILLKPVQQGLEIQKSKMTSVVAACIDHGQNRRDIEQAIAVIHDRITSDLMSL